MRHFDNLPQFEYEPFRHRIVIHQKTFCILLCRYSLSVTAIAIALTNLLPSQPLARTISQIFLSLSFLQFLLTITAIIRAWDYRSLSSTPNKSVSSKILPFYIVSKFEFYSLL